MTKETSAYRTTARIIGAMYIAGFIVGIGGDMIVKSGLGSSYGFSMIRMSNVTVAGGALLWLMAVIGDVLHGILMFPVLKLHNKTLAIGYLSFRIMDAAFIAIMVLFILLQIPLNGEFLKAAGSNTGLFRSLSALLSQGQLYAYNIGMMTLGIAGVMLCYVFYKAEILPRILSIWGLFGYIIIFLGMASEIIGSGLGLISSLPGGLWELFIGIWLILRGFTPGERPAQFR